MKNKFDPIILVTGDDEVSKNAFLDEWMDRWVAPESRQFNLDILNGRDMGPEEVLSKCLALPMLAENRIIAIRQAEKIPAKSVDLIADYADSPSPSTSLVLMAAKLDKRIKGWKSIIANAKLLEFKTPYPERIPQWLANRAGGHYKRKITSSAAQWLQALVGTNLMELDGELNKLDIFTPTGKPITEQEVGELVGSRAGDVFKWIQHVSAKDLEKSLLATDAILEHDPSATRHLALLARHFLTLLKIKLQKRTVRSEKVIAENLGLNHFFHFSKLGFGKQADVFSIPEMEGILEAIRICDRKMKTTSPQVKLMMESLVFALCMKLLLPSHA